jgi:hypothetical protein
MQRRQIPLSLYLYLQRSPTTLPCSARRCRIHSIGLIYPTRREPDTLYHQLVSQVTTTMCPASSVPTVPRCLSIPLLKTRIAPLSLGTSTTTATVFVGGSIRMPFEGVSQVMLQSPYFISSLHASSSSSSGSLEYLAFVNSDMLECGIGSAGRSVREVLFMQNYGVKRVKYVDQRGVYQRLDQPCVNFTVG